MTRKSFILHLDSLSVLDELTDEQAGKLLKACYAFNTGGELKLDQLLKIVFTPFKNQFARDAEKYKKTCEKRALAGSAGGKQRAANQANASNDKQTLANQAESVSESKSVSENDDNGQQADLIPLSENTLSSKDRIELVDKAFDYFWLNWLECKKIVGVKNGSSRKETNKRFHKIFNTAYFKKHTESEFREEINLMCDYAMDNHKNPDDFNPFKNMYTGRFLTNEGWK